MRMSIGIIGLLIFVVILVAVGGGLFALLTGGSKKSSGSKIGIIIAVLAFGMFFLVCLGLLTLFLPVSRQVAEQQRREETKERLKQVGEQMHQEQMHQMERQESNRPEPIPVELKSPTPQKVNKKNPQSSKTTPAKQPSPPPLPKETKPVEKQTLEKTTAVKQNIKIETPPAWIKQNGIKRDNKTYLVLHSDQFATTAEAESDLLKKVEAQMKAQIIIDHTMRESNYQTNHGIDGQVTLNVSHSALPKDFKLATWCIPDSILLQTIKRQYDETIERSTDKHTFKMHRLHGQIQVTRQDLIAAYKTIQNQVTHKEEKIATNNIWKAGSFLGMLTLLLGTIATYLRVDTLTNGAYRNRLRLAGAGLVVLGVSVGTYLMKLV